MERQLKKADADRFATLTVRQWFRSLTGAAVNPAASRYRNPPRLIFREQFGRRAPPGLILKIDVSESEWKMPRIPPPSIERIRHGR
jgi:hypothetical protein